MGTPAGRISDMHTCPMVTGIVPHGGGAITLGYPTVLVSGPPAGRIGDMHACAGPPDTMVLGSFAVLVGGQPLSRAGASTAHGGVVAGPGAPTVLIG